MTIDHTKAKSANAGQVGFGLYFAHAQQSAELRPTHSKARGRGLKAWLAKGFDLILERRIDQWARGITQSKPLALTLRLWTGREWRFEQSGNSLLKPSRVIDGSSSLISTLDAQANDRVVIKVLSPSAIPKLLEPSLANLGEAYAEGLIDVEGSLPAIVDMAHQLAQRTLKPEGLWGRVVRRYSHAMADDQDAIAHHYDVSNEFYKLWLDPEMVYSCAYFETGEESLAEAQLKKLDHILIKIQAQPNDRLLDIGCGWGALVIRAAQKFGCRCVGITLSQKQYLAARERVRRLGLESRIEIRLQDYREVRGEFERITSVGMFEHVGLDNLSGYFSSISRLLTPTGLAMNHGITSSDASNGQTAFGGGDFIAKYVFPGGELAHIGTVLSAMQKGGLEARDVETLRRHYARTLEAWSKGFESKAELIKNLVGEKTYRIWRIYLLGSAYAFESDQISLFQVVCGKAGRSATELPWSRRYMYRAQREARLPR
jgi:cyclopropane-fatty-acyl-phospholipid synthase